MAMSRKNVTEKKQVEDAKYTSGEHFVFYKSDHTFSRH